MAHRPLSPLWSRMRPLLVFVFAIFFGITATGCEYLETDRAATTDISSSQSEIEDDAPHPSDSTSPDEGEPGPGEEQLEETEPQPEPEPTATPTQTHEAPSQIEDEPKSEAGSALATAKTLTVKGRAPKTGYSRDQFGPAWKDIDGNGCDQRNDILNRDLTNITHKPGTANCLVLTGTLVDPFSGKTIHFERGQKTSHKVQIDHVVALSDAWQKGAQQWDAGKRIQFANDPLNLLAVDGPLNAQKGDADAATWLPPNKPFRCQYVAQLVGVKHAYSLWVTQAEQDAMVRVLSDCPNEPLPTGKVAPKVTAKKDEPAPKPKPKAEPKPKPKAEPKPKPKPKAEPKPKPKAEPQDVYYKNCTAVWDAIGRPINKGEPGYAKHLDRDGDGVGCEYKPR